MSPESKFILEIATFGPDLAWGLFGGVPEGKFILEMSTFWSRSGLGAFQGCPRRQISSRSGDFWLIEAVRPQSGRCARTLADICPAWLPDAVRPVSAAAFAFKSGSSESVAGGGRRYSSGAETGHRVLAPLFSETVLSLGSGVAPLPW